MTMIGFAFIVLLAAALAARGRPRDERSAADKPAATDGARLFESLGCSSCHETGGGGRGPSLDGFYGQTIRLENGETVTVDDQYIRISILDPERYIHTGYRPIMPTYEGRISEEELATLVEYIRSLKGGY